MTSSELGEALPAGVLPVLAKPVSRHVLVVDDAPATRELVADILRPRGCRVTSVGSAKRALTVMRMHRPDLAIIDLFMPDMSGFQFRAAMLADPGLADIPTIVLSAWWDRPAETLEAVDILPKRLNLDHLIAAVERGLDRSAADGS